MNRAAVVVLVAVASTASFAQRPPASSPEPAFEVASIKRNRSGESGSGSTTRKGGYLGLTGNFDMELQWTPENLPWRQMRIELSFRSSSAHPTSHMLIM